MNKKLENLYKYKTSDVCKMLQVSRMTLYTWEKKGKFTPPRDRHDDRVFTEKQMQDILEQFSPGGKQEWHFKG